MCDVSKKLIELADRLCKWDGKTLRFQWEIRDLLLEEAPEYIGGFEKHFEDLRSAEYKRQHGIGDTSALVVAMYRDRFREFFRAVAKTLREKNASPAS